MPPPMGLRGGGSNHLGLPSSSRRASSASVMHPNLHGPVQKKRSIPNMGKRGSNSSGVGISGLVIPPPKIVKIDENNLNDLSYQRRLSKMGNSFTSVIESSESSLYNADERRSSSRLGILPLSPLVDDGEDHPLTSSNAAEVFSDHSRRSTVVRIVTGDSDSEDKALMSERSTHHPTYPGANHNKLGMGSLGGGYERSTPSDFRGLSTFHLYLCCGMMGFVIFWVVLMLRIYLPESYWRWSYFW